MSPSDLGRLDVAGLELGRRTILIEASAGTGKTHSIAELAVRALAEEFCTIDQVLLVTYTVKATAELRGRVHRRLLESIDHFRAGSLPPGHALESAHARDPRAALRALEAAAADFDQATITTTHGFSQRMLTALGIHVDHDADATAVSSFETLHDEIADDLYLARFAEVDRPPSLADVRSLIHPGLDNPQVDLADPDSPTTSARIDLVHAARHEFDRRKRIGRVYSFNDMVSRLHDALHHSNPETAQAVAERLSERYRLVMVDEFQDTDVTQWQVIKRAFHGRSLVVLIGDPKQAIYGFRGADVHAYLLAAQEHDRYSLRHNYRSSRGVLSGVDAILNEAELGPQIATPRAEGEVHHLIEPPPGWSSATQIRLVSKPDGAMYHGTALDIIATDLTHQVSDLLENGAQIGDKGTVRRVSPRDIAVLSRSNWTGQKMADALVRAGIRTAVTDKSSVLKSEAANDWRVLATALLDVNSRSVRRAALTNLVGWSLPRLVAADDRDVDQLSQDIRELSHLWHARGFAVLADAVYSRFNVHERLLAQPLGHEQLSDTLQVAELLHAHALTERLKPSGVLGWLHRAQHDVVPGSERRMGSDADAVQVMTIHAAKGLGFPIVLLPDLWHPPRAERSPAPAVPRIVHRDGRPHLDVAVRHGVEVDPESFAESLRLAYVAMTRAKLSLRLWWAHTRESGQSALHALLAHEGGPSMPARSSQPLPRRALTQMTEHLSTSRFAGVEAVVVDLEQPPMGGRERVEQAWRRARPWTRRIDQTWRRTSYTGLTAALHDLAPGAVAAPDVEVDGLDEPALQGDSDSHGPCQSACESAGESACESAGESAGTPSLLATVAGGAEFGTLVHSILEHVDPQSPDLAATITEASAPLLRSFGEEVDAAELVNALVQVFDTPLGRLTGGTLRDIAASDRLAELDFELTMGQSGRPSTVGTLAALFSDRSLVPSDDPLAHYGQFLADTPAAEETLNGYLNGSIDAVLRVRSDQSERFVVVDYKTNTMPLAPGEVLSVEHYGAAAMTRAMTQAHYPLQAMLYTVALHRFLGWRLPGYRPEKHLGGVGYLFVRGMAGPSTPMLGGMPAGVFSWFPSPELVLAANRVLGGAR